jgi:pyridoxine 5-phosphate synthase
MPIISRLLKSKPRITNTIKYNKDISLLLNIQFYSMCRLSVNINKIALIRNSRKGNHPDLIRAAMDCERFGAEGITVHPRPDQRHVRYSDIPALKEVVQTEFNIEGYPSEDFMNLVCTYLPDQVTLVPDAPDVLTSDSGWNVRADKTFLTAIITRLKDCGMRVSLFLDPDEDMVYEAKEIGADRIEFYTGLYAEKFYETGNSELKKHIRAAKIASDCNLGINAGHDLNLENLRNYKTNISGLLEVSIGHGLICDAIYMGLENVIPMYKNQLR